MWLMAFFVLLGLAIVGAFVYLYWDFRNTPQCQWRDRVFKAIRTLSRRIKEEYRKSGSLADQEKREQAGLQEKHLAAALSRVPVEALKGSPGIGPGTIASLSAAGLTSVERVRRSSINISGFGEKRISDVRFAVRSVVAQHEQDLANPSTPLGSAIVNERKAIAERYASTRESIERAIERAESVLKGLRQFKPVAEGVTFGSYLAKSLDELVPAPYLNAPLPDIGALLAVPATVAPAPQAMPPKSQNALRVYSSEPSRKQPSPSVERPISPPRFVGRAERIQAGGYTIIEPMMYVADCARMDRFEASLLCLRRSISAPQWEPEHALGYWPQLEELKPHQVGNYLQWQSGGRKDPNIDVGYVFLFFYGLERRALIDNQDVQDIAHEVIRLLGIYNHSQSFCSYATALLCHLIVIGRLKPDPQLIELVFERQRTVISEDLKSVLIGYLAYAQQPMPARWAIQIAYTDERSRRSIVLEKCLAEFIRLFEKRYHEKFASGFVPRADGMVREYIYKPASPSLLNGTNNFSKIPIGRWPAVRSWRIQFAPVIDVWNSCIDELQSYSRRKGHGGVDEYAALPASLREEVPHPRLPEWEALLASHLPEHGALLIPAGKIAEFEGIPERAKLTLMQSKSIAEAAEGLGTPLEPDPRYTGKLYNWDSWVAVLRLSEKPVIPQTRNYLLAGVVLRLALEISEADGVTDEAERRTINEFINERFRLTNNERLRLSALMDVLLKERTSLAGLKKLLEQNLNEPQRRMIGRFLVSVAAQSNGVETSEYRALEKMYGNLGLTGNLLAEDVAEVEFKPAEAPVRVLENEDEHSEPLPQAGSVDLDRIRRLRAESEQVAEMLVTAMAETAVLHADEDHTPGIEPAQQAPAPKQASEPTSNDAQVDGQFSTLAPPLRPIVIALLKRESWPKAEAEALARSNSTSLTAAIDGINEWADEHLGDFLIEDGDPIKVCVSRAKPLLEQA